MTLHDKFTVLAGIGILLFMMILVAAAIYDILYPAGGSLDDLPADAIRQAVKDARA